jgi:hypothetical protein
MFPRFLAPITVNVMPPIVLVAAAGFVLANILERRLAGHVHH